ncbi:MAG: hydrogenase expression/formation protein HypE [Francisellaceae bacterium]
MSIKLNFKKDRVDLSIGAGGRAMNRLVESLILKAFDNQYLNARQDQAMLPAIGKPLAFTTDSYVVSPYFFPGGDIGQLAICGTINDLAVSGATAKYISLGLILEEGLPLAELKCIIESMAKTANEAGVMIVTGDTKVVEKGKGDGIFINTSGIGVIDKAVVNQRKPEKGDKIIINGNIAEHGTAVMSKRRNLSFLTDVQSDVAWLGDLIGSVADAGISVKTMRDPTRGGIAATLNEWASLYGVSFEIDESALPITLQVASACELLGLDPLFIANEGKVMMICEAEIAEQLVQVLRAHPKGKDACIIGEVVDELKARVSMRTVFGGLRHVDWLSGEQLPRIC